MPRRRRLRKVVAPPNFKGYRPFGNAHDELDTIDLLYEEYEALKLADYDLMNHEEASKLMGVSRATFARIYESARRKIAKALVEVKELRTVYGNVVMEDNWFECGNCHSRFTKPPTARGNNCPLCKHENIFTLKK